MNAAPLFRFFIARRVDRAQLVFLFLFLAGAVHLSFFSLDPRGPLERRLWLLDTWLPIILPILLVDGDMKRGGPARVFVWPRQGIGVLTVSYVLASGVRGLIGAACLALLTINTQLLATGASAVWSVLACAGLGLFVASFVVMWNIVAGGRTVYPVIYAAGAALLWLVSRMINMGVPRVLIEILVLPYWILSPSEAIQDSGGLLLPAMQVLVASAVWMTIAGVAFHRSYRGRAS